MQETAINCPNSLAKRETYHYFDNTCTVVPISVRSIEVFRRQPMTKSVRFAVVGLGMGKKRAEQCAQTPGAELAAVCDISENRGRKAEKEWSVPWIRNFDELIARDDIDVVGLWTPSGSHSKLAQAALHAGKHVCMTKPMDISTEACDAAIDAAQSQGLLLGIDFEQRYKSVNYCIKRAISTGAIGNPLLVDLRLKWYRGQTYYNTGFPIGWRGQLDTEGGSLANQAVHFIDLMLWWMGNPLRVVGQKGTYGHNIETEDGTTAVIQFKNGATGSLLTTTCSFPDAGAEINIIGSWGSLHWSDGHEPSITHVPQSKRDSGSAFDHESVPTACPYDLDAHVNYSNSISNIFEDMVSAINGQTELICDGMEGRRSVELFEAVYKASDSQSWITVE